MTNTYTIELSHAQKDTKMREDVESGEKDMDKHMNEGNFSMINHIQDRKKWILMEENAIYKIEW